MRDFIKKIKHKKWEVMFYFRNSFYYFCARKDKELRPIDKKNVKVCFILQRTEIFTSVQSIFEKMCSDDRFSVSILVLPRYDHANKRVDVDTIEKNLCFCEELGGMADIINPYCKDQDGFEDLSKYEFDFIFLGLPYAGEYPEEYHFDKLSRISRLCYVPYGSSYADGLKMIRVSVTDNLLKNVDYLFADCNKVYQYCYSKLNKCKNVDSKQIVYDIGFPRFDLIDRNKKKESIPMVFLWLPRWTTNMDNNEKSTFFENKDKLISYFQKHPELTLIIRPHPLMFAHYIDTGVMTGDEVDNYKAVIDKTPNIELDEGTSYIKSFMKADCLIADYTSVVIEYFITGQPIIYLNDTDMIEKSIAETFYVSKTPEQTISFINQLTSDGDEKSEMRIRALSKGSYENNVNYRIISTLLS